MLRLKLNHVSKSGPWPREHLNAELHADDCIFFHQDHLRAKCSRRSRDSEGVAINLTEDLAATAYRTHYCPGIARAFSDGFIFASSL